MTKLCDLGPTDSVCSVQWTREGSYISIGTSLGQVQVEIICLKILYQSCIETWGLNEFFLSGLGWHTMQEG